MMKIRLLLSSVLCILFFLAGSAPLQAQLSEDYFRADQLLQQQKYEEAYQILAKVYEKYPGTYIVLEKATECLINLKRYDKAIELVKSGLDKGFYQAQGNIRLGEIYHISGDTERAFEVWDGILERFGENNMQVYLALAQTMEERKVFDRAIEVYRKARSEFENSSLITTELANTYLQAGRYEEAIREFLQLVEDDPDRINYVQTRLIRLQDDSVYDVAILEIEDFLEELSGNHPSRNNLHQLELWLLMERGLHERAVVTAKNYEDRSSQVTYALYSLGSRLLAEKKFSLAEQVYSYYIDNDLEPAKYRSMEELANVNIEWATYLENYNLAFSAKRDSLYNKAFSVLESLRKSAPNYQRMSNVLIKQAELALDILHIPDKAREYLAELENYSDSTSIARRNYIEGRIKLYEKDYSRARIALTRSNKQENTGDLAQKTRYYLALTDFFAGDYEYAKIQLRALERQNTSYFANDAMKLRLWIQQGLQADSTGEELEPFAQAIEHFALGNEQLAIHALQDVLQPNSFHPLADEALLELSTHANINSVPFLYRAIDHYLNNYGSSSPMQERLMWEKARIADQLITNEDISVESAEIFSDSLTTEQNFSEGFKSVFKNISIPSNIDQLMSLYEEILMEFPDGFYASYARERIQELQNIQT